MTKETYEKAQSLNERISHINYLIARAQKIKNETFIYIVSRNSRGDEEKLAEISRYDILRTYIADQIIKRLQVERHKEQDEFDNL